MPTSPKMKSWKKLVEMGECDWIQVYRRDNEWVVGTLALGDIHHEDLEHAIDEMYEQWRQSASPRLRGKHIPEHDHTWRRYQRTNERASKRR